MYPKPIDRYLVPTSLAEGLALRAAHAGSTVLAGGQSLVPRLKARVTAASTLLDLNRIAELSAIERTPHGFRLGALVRHRAAATHPALRHAAAVLCDAALAVGDLQVRNRGTLVGSVCWTDPSGDIAPAAIALGAHVRLASAARGTRLLPVCGFEPAAIRDDEIVTHLEFLTPVATVSGAYCKVGRVAQDRAIASAAVQLEWAPTARVTRAVIVLGGIAALPQPMRTSAALLEGGALERTQIAACAAHAAAACTPRSDGMASAEYRRQLVASLVAAALEQAGARAGIPGR